MDIGQTGWGTKEHGISLALMKSYTGRKARRAQGAAEHRGFIR